MIRAYSFSTAGGHAVNEDAFLIRELQREPACYLVALADGQGGLEARVRLNLRVGLCPSLPQLTLWPSTSHIPG
jgi:hypothetical protein